MRKITVKKQSSFGVKSSDYNVYSNGRQVGYCQANEVDQVLRGNLSLCCPISSWRDRFSVELKKSFGLPLGSREYDDKEQYNSLQHER